MIKSILIKNIRGIGEVNNKFDVNVKENRPVFFVAPNGFGKSSIAVAFNSLGNRSRIDVNKKNIHKIKDLDHNRGNEELNAEIIFNFNDNILIADNNKNEIIKEFEIKVINNPVFPFVRRKKLESGFNVETGEMKIPDVIIINKIPEKKSFDYYKITETRKLINSKTNVWENLSVLFEDKRLLSELSILLIPFEKIKPFKKIEEFIRLDEALLISNISKIECQEFIFLRDSLIRKTKKEIIEASLICIQLIYFFKNNILKFKEVILYYKYLIDKEYIDSFFYGKTWKVLKPKEIDVKDKKTKK